MRDKLLTIAPWFIAMSQIRFDAFASDQIAGNMESADVCGPSGSNAVPGIVVREPDSQPVSKVAGLSDVMRNPPAGGRVETTEDVDAGPLVVFDQDAMQENS